jgi:MutS domain V
VKVFLMYEWADFDVKAPLPPNERELRQDLELDTLFDAMGGGDAFIRGVSSVALLTSLPALVDPRAVRYRQAVLADCLRQQTLIHVLYDLTIEALRAESSVFRGFSRSSPDMILYRALEVLDKFVPLLKQLRGFADDHSEEFSSPAFQRLFSMLKSELGDDYFAVVEAHLSELRFPRGVLISAELGHGNQGTEYVLRRQRTLSWRERLAFRDRDGFSFKIAERDEAGLRALEALRGQGINLAADALNQSVDHILHFWMMLKAELGFYIGCLNLYTRLRQKRLTVSFPVPAELAETELSASGLYDVSLALISPSEVMGNDVAADSKKLVMITGANQGGKSTFLRSVGQAQLMMQAGMFVGAEHLGANTVSGIFTHYKREEDATMESGKLDEELSRMSTIADQIHPNALLLCNESFAATNEREGSEIARQVIDAMTESAVKVIFVTHQYDLAHGIYERQMAETLFLRAQRRPGEQRTFRLSEGEPLPTSYGEDSYQRVFGHPPRRPADQAEVA